jgi:hypothetical protein
VHGQHYAPFKALGLLCRGCLERFPMRSKPGMDNAVAAHSSVYATGNGFYLRQFWHLSIVKSCAVKIHNTTENMRHTFEQVYGCM